ncbi:hypothetical protein COHA_005451 [Chlorella ohadii]|uniref:AAA+ ATPase domain-containing protein n=1 Tax=Chlorella ohadii TaxID=2649997 RepID=A0AAD5H1Q1_9CHLO|nr:hypothetical protein COHA_005451 [Chlorella ohadii]
MLLGSHGPLRSGVSGLTRRQQTISCSAAAGGDSAPRARPQEVAQIAVKAMLPKVAGSEETAQVAVQAAQTLDEKLGEMRKTAKRLYDRVYYGDVLPPIGSFQISYARLLMLLHDKRVKRIILLSDGRSAIVEIPVENTESDFETVTYDRRNVQIQYAEEVPEWQMEKNRYYVELPGDVMIDGELRIPYGNMLQINQVRPELQVVDPGDAYVWLNQYQSQFLPILGLLGLRMVVGAGEWLLRKLGKEKKSEQEQLAESLGQHRAREYNVEEEGKKGGKRKGTGVKYDDVAGIDHIKADVKEVLDILLGDERYVAMGAHPVRGVLLEGPPGTGKTLLAKAMAGEAGIPFYSANGAEFVEMFQGVAAARIRSLFRTARKKAPAIIFIDEIDAIGKARSSGPTDSGTQEREQGLLQLLTEMDGFYQDDKVLVVAATNRADALDEALLRPGRFDRTIYMGRPSPANRLKILQVHARNKPLDRSNDDALLRQIADLAIGYSGAELANLMNEAAILAVRRSQPEIDLPILKEAMDKIRLGLPQDSLPDSAAKRQYATIEAARAVAFALTPGMPQLEHEFGREGGTWHALATPEGATNAVQLDKPLSQLEVACGLLTPLYVARACEEVLYGRESVSLSTSKEVSRAGELARWIVMDSGLHPATRDEVVRLNLRPGGKRDPTVKWAWKNYDDLIMDLQRRAYEAALRLVAERATVIRTVGNELCDNKDETVLGSRVIDLLLNTPKNEAAAAAATAVAERAESGAAASSSGRAAAEEVREALGEDVYRDPAVVALAEVVMGKVSEWELLPGNKAATKAERVRQQLLDPAERQRLAAQAEFATSSSESTPFPPAPPAPLAGAPPAVEAAEAKGKTIAEVELPGFEGPGAGLLKL